MAEVPEAQGKRDLILVTIAFLVLVAASIVVWQARPKTSTDKQVAQIVEDPQRYYGQRVTLTGNVGSILGSRAFTLDAPGVAVNKLLIISKTPIEPIGGSGLEYSMFQPSERVQIKGHVEYFSIQDVENELNADLVNSVFLPWEGRPVIVADEVQKNQ
jgi:hypothetical protein